MNKRGPKSIALYSAIIVAASVTIGLIISNQILNKLLFLWVILLSLIIGFVVTYFTVNYFVEKFLHQKIKLIYRSIHTQKLNSLENSKTPKTIDEVDAEVKEWVNNKQDEISKLQEQEEFRRRFIGNLSHELKTPIFSIQGYILTLLDGGLEDENVNREFLLRASRGVDRITHILDDLDIITKLESGQINLKIESFDIRELAKDVMESMEIKAKNKNIKLLFKEKSDKPILVDADKGRIGQVFTNLIANSINYGKNNGKTEIRFHDMHESVLIEVADDGPGIDKKHLPQLFERFYRVDKSRSRNEGGTGLGLAIVKHIIESHEQSINVRSTVNVGSTFSFTLKKSIK